MICYLWARYDVCSACQKAEMSLACRGGRQDESGCVALLNMVDESGDVGGRQGEWRSVALLNMVDESGDAGGRQGESGCVALGIIPFCPPSPLALFSSVLLLAGIFLLHSHVSLSVAVSEWVFPVALSCCSVCAYANAIGMIMVLGMPFGLIYIIFTSKKERYSVRIFCSLMIKQYLCNRF